MNTQTTFTNNHWIASPNQSEFETKIAKLVKKADKCGQTIAWAYTGNTETRKQAKYDPKFGTKIADTYYQALEVTITGISPQINGWAFVGAIEHLVVV